MCKIKGSLLFLFFVSTSKLVQELALRCKWSPVHYSMPGVMLKKELERCKVKFRVYKAILNKSVAPE